MNDRYEAHNVTTTHIWLDRDGWHVEHDQPTPRERLNRAIHNARGFVVTLEEQDLLADAAEQMMTWIRQNRGRLHRATCMDGNGCRCGLIDLPIWGGAGELE
jgi:hypothetical protein